MSDHQTADHAVKIAGITCLVRNAKCLDAAHGLFRQVGVIKDDKIRSFGTGLALKYTQ